MHSDKDLQEMFQDGQLIARALYTESDRKQKALFNLNFFEEELSHLHSSKKDGTHKNVERAGQRNRSATLLVPDVRMDLFHDVGFLYDADKSTVRGYMFHDGTTLSPSPDFDKEFFNLNIDKSKLEPILSREAFIKKYKEYRERTDGTSQEHTSYNEVLGNFYPESLAGLVSQRDTPQNKLKLLSLKNMVYEKHGIDLPMTFLNNGKMVSWQPSLKEVEELISFAKSNFLDQSSVKDVASDLGYQFSPAKKVSIKSLTPKFKDKASAREVIDFVSDITDIPKGGKFTHGIAGRLTKIINKDGQLRLYRLLETLSMP